MESVDYILRIILRLRDEASTKLAAIRAEVRGIGSDADASKAKLDGINSSVSSLTRRLGNLNKRIAEVKTTVMQIGDDSDIDSLGASFDGLSKEVSKITAARLKANAVAKEAEADQEKFHFNTKRRARELVDAGVDPESAAKLAKQQRDTARLAFLQEKQNRAALAADIKAEADAALGTSGNSRTVTKDSNKGTVAKVVADVTPAVRKLNFDLIRFSQIVDEEGKKFKIATVKSTGEVIAQFKGMRAVNRAVAKYLEALEDGADATEESNKETKDDTKKKRTRRTTTQRRQEEALVVLDDQEREARERADVEAEDARAAATIKKDELAGAKAVVPAIKRDVEDRKKLSSAQKEYVDALEDVISIKVKVDSIGRTVATITQQTEDLGKLKATRIDQRGDVIGSPTFSRFVDPTTIKKPVAGSAPGGRRDINAEVRADFDKAHPELSKELNDLETSISDAKQRVFVNFKEHQAEVLNFLHSVSDAFEKEVQQRGFDDDQAKGLFKQLQSVPRDRDTSIKRLYELERLGSPTKRLIDLMDLLVDDGELLSGLESKLGPLRQKINVAVAPIRQKIVEEERAARGLDKDGFRPISGSAPGGRTSDNNVAELLKDLHDKITSEEFRRADLRSNVEREGTTRSPSEFVKLIDEATESIRRLNIEFNRQADDVAKGKMDVLRPLIQVVQDSSSKLRQLQTESASSWREIFGGALDGARRSEDERSEIDKRMFQSSRDLDEAHATLRERVIQMARGLPSIGGGAPGGRPKNILDEDPDFIPDFRSAVSEWLSFTDQEREESRNFWANEMPSLDVFDKISDKFDAIAKDLGKLPPIGGGAPGSRPDAEHRQLADLNESISKRERELASAQRDLGHSRNMFQGDRPLADVLNEKIGELEHDIDRLKTQFSSLAAPLSKFRDQIDSLDGADLRAKLIELAQKQAGFTPVPSRDDAFIARHDASLAEGKANKVRDSQLSVVEEMLGEAKQFARNPETVVNLQRNVDELRVKVAELDAEAHRLRAISDEIEALRRADEQLRIEGGAPGSKGGGKKPPSTPKVAADFFDDDQERAFQKHERKVNDINATYERLVHTLGALRGEFHAKLLDEDSFLFQAANIRQQLDRLAKSSPSDFSHGKNVALDIFQTSKAIQDQIDKLKDLKVAGKDIAEISAGFEKIKRTIGNVTDEIQLSRGALQILRREGERMKDLGIGGLTAEMTQSQRALLDLQAKLAAREKSGDSTKTVEKDIQRLASRLQAQRESLRQLLADATKLDIQAPKAPTLAHFVEPAEAERVKHLGDEFDDLLNTFEKVQHELKQGKIDREVALKEFEEIGKAINKLAIKEPIGSSSRRQLAAEATDILNVVKAHREAAEAQRKFLDDQAKTYLTYFGKVHDSSGKFNTDLDEAQTKQQEKEAVSRRKFLTEQAAMYLSYYDKVKEAGSKLVTKLDGDALKQENSLREHQANVAALQTRLESAQQGTGVSSTTRGQAVELRKVGQEFDKLARSTHASAEEANNYGVVASRAAQKSKQLFTTLRGEVEETGGLFERLTNKIKGVGIGITGTGDSVAKLDNQLRGLIVLALFAFAQQLLTSLTGLAGGLVSVGSSAVFAGGALGGSFVAGLAQAVPAVLLLVAAMQQVKGVTDAITQAELVRQQGFHAGLKDKAEQAKTDNQAASKADAILSAQEGLAGAQDQVTQANKRLKDAQDGLNKAREDAKKNLLELIAAEHSAELAARGAALSEVEAQDALRKALEGGSNLDLQRARLDVLESTQGKRDADRGVTTAQDALAKGSPINQVQEVKAAQKGVEDAKKSVEDAGRAVDKATRGIAAAKRNADVVDDAASTGADKLLFLLQQLSPAQLGLFGALQKIRLDFKENFTGITDVIIDSFTRAVDTADKILKNPLFLGTALELAKAISGAFDAIREHFFEDPEKLDQLFSIISDGAANIAGPVTDIAISIGDAFVNIADAAGPSLTRLLGWVSDLAGDLADTTENTDKLETFFGLATTNAIGWLDLIKNVLIFFAVLSGAGQAEGLTLIDKLNDAVIKATDFIRTHRTEVDKFFQDSGRVVLIFAAVILAVGQAIAKVFDPGKLDEFSQFLTETLLPALVGVTKVVGLFIDLLLTILNAPVIGKITEIAILITIFAALFTSIAGAFAFLFLKTGHFFELFAKIAGAFGLANGPAGKFVGILAEMAAKSALLAPLAAVLGKISGSLIARGGAATAANAENSVLDTIISASGGPTGTTKGGKTFKTVPRKGILGKLGLGKVVADEADDAARAAEKIGGKTATKFSSTFLGGAKGLLKGSVWVTLGIGAVEGIISGFKTHSLESGIRDFAHSITFGIVKSSGQIAQEALTKEVIPRLKKGIPIKQLTDDEIFDKPTPVKTIPGQQINPRQQTGQFASSQADKDALKFAAALEKIKKSQPDLADAIEKFEALQQVFADARKHKDLTGMQGAIDSAKTLADKFPELSDAADGFATRVEKAMDRVRLALRPNQITADLGLKLLSDPNKDHFKGFVDDAVKQLGKLPPKLREQGRTSIIEMIKGLESQGSIPAETAKTLTGEVETKFGEMKVKISKHAQRATKNFVSNLQIMLDVATAMAPSLVDTVNTALQALGAGPIKKFKAPTPKQLGGFLGAATSLLNAKGGIIGMAGGGLLGMMGERGKDLIPALLGRGEMVLNSMHQRYLAPAVAAYYGHPLEETFKRLRGEHAGPTGFGGLPGFRLGTDGGGSSRRESNLFDGHPVNVAAAIKELLETLKKKFPTLQVTSTTDHGLRTSNGNISDHSTGHAIDVSGPIALMNAVTRYIKSSGISKQLSQGIHNPGLSIVGGSTVPSSYWGTDTWAQHANHLHLAITGALGKIKDVAAVAVGNIKKQVFKWPEEGGLKKLGQAAFDKLTEAANKKLKREAKKSAEADLGDTSLTDEGSIKLASGSRAKKIFSYFRDRGFSDSQAAAWVGNFVQESGLNPAIVQPNGEGHGLAQWGGGRFEALKQFATSRGTKWQDLQTQLDYVWAELLGPEGKAFSGIKDSKSIESAVEAIATLYERAGIIGDRVSPALQAYRKFAKPSFKDGGIVPGGDGQPVDITAHAGEWVVNKLHQSKIANMLGVTPDALRSMLGFYGGPKTFAGSGTVTADETASNATFSTAAEKARIKNILKGIFALPAIPVTAWADVVEVAKQALKAINVSGKDIAKRLRTVNKEIDKIKRGGVTEAEKPALAEAQNTKQKLGALDTSRLVKATDALTQDGGIIDKLDDARAALVAQMSNGLTAMSLKIVKFTVNGKKKWRVEQVSGAIAIADRELTNSRVALENIVGEQGIITTALKAVNARLHKLRKGGVSNAESKEVQDLTQQQNNLKTRAADLASAQAVALQAVFDAQIAAQQAVVDDITKQAGQRETGFGLRERLANLFGDKGALNQIATDRILSMQQEVGALQSQLAGAQALGNVDLATSIQNSIDDLNVSIQEQIQTRITNLVDAVNKTAENREFTAGIIDRILAITGNKGALNQVINGRISAARQQINGLADALNQARASGNTNLANEIEKQIQDLQVTIAELAKQKIQNAIDLVNDAAAHRATALDIKDRIAAVFGNKGSLNAIVDGRITSIQTQMKGLKTQLAGAQKAGNADLVLQLKEQIADLGVTIQELAKQKIQNAIDEVNHQASVREFALGIRQRLAELFGNTGAIAQIATDRVASIRTQITDLQAQLAAAQQAGNADLVESLSQSIIDLQTTIVETINGQLRAAMDQINNVSGRRGSRLDLFGRLADALGQVGLGGSATIGGETLSRAGVFDARNKALVDQRASLQQLLRVTQSTPESAQNTQLIQDLTDQLAELDVTIKENTKAAFQARIDDVNATANFSLNVLSLQQRIAELRGTLTQTDSAEAVRALLEQRSLILEQQNTALSLLLTAALAASDQSAINDLTTQLLDNEAATLENSIAIRDLSNSSDLQQFSSSAWLQFREAIFDGLGNLLPKFSTALPSAAMGAHIMQGGMINVHAGEDIVPAKVVAGETMGGGRGDINLGGVHVTNPTEVADPVYLGNAIGWRIVNNPNLRP